MRMNTHLRMHHYRNDVYRPTLGMQRRNNIS